MSFYVGLSDVNKETRTRAFLVFVTRSWKWSRGAHLLWR